ncbi:YadA-like family protein [Salmonella enterica]|nr:YadA-like family protein [Salmonella enterica]
MAEATGIFSTATGNSAHATGSGSTATGETANASGNYSTATGEGAQATNEGSTATGAKTQATGYYSTATGVQAHAIGGNSTATGGLTQATGSHSTATGWRAQATGLNSTATGVQAQANGYLSTATGGRAQATGDNSVALGESSRASHKNEVNIGIWDFSTNTQTETRTLSGLADGVKDDEAVNMRQLNEVKDNLAKTSGISRGDAEGLANAAKDKAVEEANQNTDDKITALNLDAKLSTADGNAKGYAATAQSEAEKTAKGYADTVKGEAIKEANIYTDNSASQTLSNANRYTNHRAVQAENNAVARSNAYTDNRFGELRKSLEHTEKRLNAGVAGVTALSSIPYAAGNNFSYGIGAGNYQNGNAVAAGVQLRVSSSTNVRLNISWDSAGNNATGVGIAGGW